MELFGLLLLLLGFGFSLLVPRLVEGLLDDLLLEGTRVAVLPRWLALFPLIPTREVLLGRLVLHELLRLATRVTLAGLLALCCSLSFLMRSSREISAIK